MSWLILRQAQDESHDPQFSSRETDSEGRGESAVCRAPRKQQIPRRSPERRPTPQNDTARVILPVRNQLRRKHGAWGTRHGEFGMKRV